MSIIHLNHIKKRLQEDFCPHVDVSDWASAPAPQREAATVSRALAAFVLAETLQAEPRLAAADVTDGSDDNGIDGVGIDSEAARVVVVQSKWDGSGTGSPALGDVQKFAQGFRDLINARFDRFNAKVRSKTGELTAALDNPDVQFEIILAHSGQAALSEEAKRVFLDLLEDLNDVSEIATFRMLAQSELHGFVRRAVSGKAPDLEVTLYDWGKTDEPYTAFYGQVDAADVAEWWSDHGVRLFDQNLRKFIPDSSVNASIIKTLLEDPQRFWYFNNGVTVLCKRVAKAAAAGTARKTGKFTFEGASVVNGAQTVGCIGQAADVNLAAVQDARVSIRFISLDGGSPNRGHSSNEYSEPSRASGLRSAR